MMNKKQQNTIIILIFLYCHLLAGNNVVERLKEKRNYQLTKDLEEKCLEKILIEENIMKAKKLVFNLEIKNNLDSLGFFFAPYWQQKYKLQKEFLDSLADITNTDLKSSAYYKKIVDNWKYSDKMKYLLFRMEWNILKRKFSNFKLSALENSPFYKNLLTDTGLEKDKLDSILGLVENLNFTPIHFYYKPHSIREQLRVDHVTKEEIKIEPLVEFYQEYQEYLEEAEKIYKVNGEIIVAILRKETNLGKVKLKYNFLEVILAQLLYSINNPLEEFEAQLKQTKRIKRLQNSAYKSLLHGLNHIVKNKINLDQFKSNFVGAIGYVQFMPFNLHLAKDGNEDGIINLSTMEDSIFSIAHFLSYNGWTKKVKLNKVKYIKKQIAKYNRNKSYIDSVYLYAKLLHEALK